MCRGERGEVRCAEVTTLLASICSEEQLNTSVEAQHTLM